MKFWGRSVFLFAVFIFVGYFFVYCHSDVSEPPDFQNPGKSFMGETNLSSEPYAVQITEKSVLSGKSLRTYSWNYEGYCWNLTLLLDDEFFKVYKERTRDRDYDLFASDPYDDRLIENIADTFISLSEEYGLEKPKVSGLCISFVQSLNYSSDLISSGYEQYPRFPYETLYESGGDCEDTSILSAAILQQMGYDVVLLELPEHMALGISCDQEQEGKAFEYNSKKYYYVETTGLDWQIGEIPEEYQNQPVRFIPIYKRSFLTLDFKALYEYSDAEGTVDVNVTLRNLGSVKAENTTLFVTLESPSGSETWDWEQSPLLTLEPEETYCYCAKGLQVPEGERFRVSVQAFRENVLDKEIKSEWIQI